MITLNTDISYSNLYLSLLTHLNNKQSTVLAESWIVVPNHSAKQWLQKSLARDLGVCAQIKFIMPLSFNWEIIKNVASQEHKVNIFSKDVLRWQILTLLKGNHQYSFLRQRSDIKNFHLAEKTAQTLLKYNEEHPQIIAQWDKEIHELSPHYQWQVEVWLELQKILPTKSPVQLLELFDASKDFKQQPANIILFAIEQLTSLQKATILKLSKNQEILIYLSNASPNDYWFDLKPAATKARNQIFKAETADIIDVGNPILANLGYNKMAIFDAFLQEDIDLQASDNHYTGSSLLQSLKQDIFALLEKPAECKVDNSIKIHSCHNRQREIEIIQDEILDNLAADKQLNPEDIIVVAPDINDYVTSIKKTFSNKNNSQYLPFHIDRVQLADNQYILALMKLLHSFAVQASAPVLYELFCQTTILKKLNISENDLPRIKNWILNSNIRNFFSARHKSKLGYEHKQGNTWQFGKNRWLAGYLADDVDNELFLSTYGQIAGQEDLFAQCFEFLDTWFDFYQQAQEGLTPQKWLEFIKKLCKDLLYNDILDDYERKISIQLENKLITETLGCQQSITLVILNNIVETVITENNYRSEGQIGIRFQTWENAFVVDAKLLIILGLNDNEFPKKQPKNDLDIYSKTPSRLNKSIRQRDKNLMLTALTENTDKLIMTYIGFNAKTNDTQPPSVILAEIISYLQQKTNNEFKVITHKMHGYNQYYFSQNNRSYNQQHYQLAKSYYQTKDANKSHHVELKSELEAEREAERGADINLNDLIKFFIDPLDFFLKKHAHINHGINQSLLQDTETYQVTGLEAWQIRQEIFKHGLNTASKTGIISDNKFGQIILKKLDDELKPLISYSQEQNLQKKSIEIKIDTTTIFATIELDSKQQLISIFPNKAKAKNICTHWLQHLCYQTYKQAEQVSYLHFQDKSFKFLPVENHQSLLVAIIEKWYLSYSKPWLFCPYSILKILSKTISCRTQKDYLKQFIQTDNSFPSAGQQYFINDVELYDNHQDIEQFIMPLVNNIEIFKLSKLI